MNRATLGRPRIPARFTIERLRTLVLIGGGVLVAAIAIFLAAGQWKLRRFFQDAPRRLGIDIEQTADGVDYTQTSKGKTIFKLHAAKAITRKTGGTTILHDVKIDLYGVDGNRADTISGSEFEYDPNAGIATAAGPVEILMMRPGVKPAISELKPAAAIPPNAKPAQATAKAKQPGASGKGAAVSPVMGAITDDEIHIKTSGLTFNQKTGVATTDQRVDFALRQGNGNAIGATYDSPNGHLVLDHAVELVVDRNTAGGDGGPVKVHASHAEFQHDAMECQMTGAHAEYTGGTVETAHALIHFREDGSVIRVDGSDGVDLRTLKGSHVTAPKGWLDFDAKNHPQHGLLDGGTRLEMNEPNRQVQGTSPMARLNFDAQGELSQAHMEQGVVFNSQQQVTTAKGDEAQVRRTWNSRTADVAFAEAPASDAKPGHPAGAGKPEGHVEPRTIHGFGGVVVTSQTVTGGVTMPSRLAADTVVAELAPGGALSSLHGDGHASFDEKNAAGVHQATTSDVLDVRFVPQAKGAGKMAASVAGAKRKDGAASSEIASVVEVGHVVLIQDPAPASQAAQKTGQIAQKAGSPVAPAGIRATANRSDYDGATQILHLTGSPRVHDGAMDMTANAIDFARASGDAFAHGDVRASWTRQDLGISAPVSSIPGGGLLAGGSAVNPAGSGGNGPIHAIAAEAELHQATQEIIFRGAGKAGLPRLWQAVNSVSAPVITLNRAKQTLVAVANGAAEPVRTVLVSNGGLAAAASGNSTEPGAAKSAKASSPSVIRVKSGDLRYSEAERVAIFHGGTVGQVTAETTDSGGTSTMVSQQAEVTLFPAGTHAAPKQASGDADAAGPAGPASAAAANGGPNASTNASIDRLTALGHVVIDWPGRRGTGEKLVYRSEDGNYTLTGTAAAPPRIVDEARGTITGSALILHSGDDRVTVEGDGGKTATETRSKK
jgi:lipopolysaccharide export system protein LptA